MAKKETAQTKANATPKKERKTREKKDSYLKDNYVQINDFNGIITEVMHIKTIGAIVRERNTKTGHVSSVFVPGVKPKTKKDYRYLVVDKGPKQKKDKK